jgi:hypothetical protein
MMYREIEKEEADLNNGDYKIRVWGEGELSPYAYLRPVRDIDDLTDEELMFIYDTWRDVTGLKDTIRAKIKKADELRSRPKETEKERWIRVTHDRCKKIPSQWDFTEELAKTWDAAYEAGRKAK